MAFPVIVALCLGGIIIFLSLMVFTLKSKKKISLGERVVYDSDQLFVDQTLKSIHDEELYAKNLANLNWFQRKERELEQSNTGIKMYTYIAMIIVIGMGTFVVVNKVLNSPILSLPFAIIGYYIPPIIVKKIREKKIAEFDKSLIKVLRRMAADMRAGNSLQQAIEDVVITDSLPDIVRGEFKQVLSDLRVGKSPQDAFFGLFHKTGSKEVQFLAIAVEVQTKKGGNLSETFDKVSSVISDKIIKESDMKATMAQLKATSSILIVLPFILPIIIYSLSPKYFDPLLATMGGRFFILGCFAVIFFGAFIIKKLSKIDL